MRIAQQRAARNLIWAYGEQRQRVRVLKTLAHSVFYGLSLRTVLYAGLAFCGPRATRLVLRFYSTKVNKSINYSKPTTFI